MDMLPTDKLLLLGALLVMVQCRLCPDPICPEDDGTNRTVLLPSADCRNFYSCTWGFPTLLACPPGLRYSHSVPGCVPEENADCSECENPPQDGATDDQPQPPQEIQPDQAAEQQEQQEETEQNGDQQPDQQENQQDNNDEPQEENNENAESDDSNVPYMGFLPFFQK